MSDFYAIMLGDLSKPEDVCVDRRVNRAAAERVVRELNRVAVAVGGGLAPLYYVERASEPKASTTAVVVRRPGR